MGRRAGHRGLIKKTKSQRQRAGRKKESRKMMEANARAARQGY